MHKRFKAYGKQNIELSPTARINKNGELLLYGVIGDWFDGLDAVTIVSELDQMDGETIQVRFHSPGGDVLEGLAMYQAFKNSKKRVIGYIDGIAASMAASIAMACDTLYIPSNAMMMIHKPNFFLCGNFNAVDFQALAKRLDNFEPSVVQLIADKTGKTLEEIRAYLADGDDHFFTGQEAIDFGLADELIDYVKVDAKLALNHSLPSAQAGPLRAVAVAGFKPEEQPGTYYLEKGEPVLTRQAWSKLEEFLKPAAAAVLITPQEKPMKIKSTRGAALAALVTAALVSQYDSIDAAVTALGVTKEILNGDVEASMTDLGKLADALKVEMPAQQQNQNPEPQANGGDALAERKRIQDLTKIAASAKLDDDTLNQWIEKAVSVDAAREKALAAMVERDAAQLPNGNHVRGPKQVSCASAVAQALLVRTSPGTYTHDDNSKEFVGMSMIEMAKAVLGYSGVSVNGKTKVELATLAMHSTSDFPLLLADVANKELLRAYKKKPKTYQKIARRSTATDFKLKHSVELGSGSQLEKVNEKGEFKHGTLSEKGYSYALDSYGKIFSFTRKLLINDDLSAFTNFMAQAGSKTHSLEEKIVWDLIKLNPQLLDGFPVFSSTAAHKRNNLITDASIAAALKSAVLKFAAQTDLDGEEIDIQASILAVPYARWEEAQKALTAVLATTTSEVNVYANALEIVPVTRLDGVANNPFYFFADPDEAPVMEYAHLEGAAEPRIETELGFEVDGMKLKVAHDFGAGFVGTRGAVKSTGAG